MADLLGVDRVDCAAFVMEYFSKYRRGIAFNFIGSAILAFGIYNIHSVSGVTEGGALGLTLLFEQWFGVSPSVTNLLISTACYFFGWRMYGKDFLVYSAFAAGGFSAFYAVFERFPRLMPGIAAHPFWAAIIGALFVGVGVGICVRYGGAPNADDALAMSLEKKTGIPIQWLYFISDITVLALSLTYIPVTRIVWSLITVFISGQLIGIISKARIPN